MIMRKIKSFIKVLIRKKNDFQTKLLIKLLENNIEIGKNVCLGKNVIIKTTDDGKIKIGNNVTIEDNCYIYAQKGKIEVGDNSFIGFGSQIVAKDNIQIGKFVLIAAYSIIRDSNHGLKKNTLILFQEDTIKPILIEDDVWIGAHCVVTAGSKIEKGAVIGANAVVTKNIKEYSIAVGVPAKIIKERE